MDLEARTWPVRVSQSRECNFDKEAFRDASVLWHIFGPEFGQLSESYWALCTFYAARKGENYRLNLGSKQFRNKKCQVRKM